MNAVCRRLHSTLAPEVVYELILGDFLECFDVTFVFNPIKIKRNSRKARFVSCSFLQRPCLLTVKFTPNHHAIICTGCFFFVIKTSQRRRLAISSELCFPASSGECLVNTSISRGVRVRRQIRRRRRRGRDRAAMRQTRLGPRGLGTRGSRARWGTNAGRRRCRLFTVPVRRRRRRVGRARRFHLQSVPLITGTSRE